MEMEVTKEIELACLGDYGSLHSVLKGNRRIVCTSKLLCGDDPRMRSWPIGKGEGCRSADPSPLHSVTWSVRRAREYIRRGECI